MRWRMIAAVGILAAILAGGLAFRSTVEEHCGMMETLLRQAEKGSQPALTQARDLWEARLGLLSTLVNHEKLETVGEILARAEGLLTAGESADAAAQIHTVRYLLEDIREYDDINWKNLW